MRRLAPSAVLTALAIAGCTEPTSPVSDGVLNVRAQDSLLQIENTSSAPVHRFIVERAYAARINWAGCAGPACPAIDAGAVVEIPYSLIAGYSSGAREAIVYWWRSVPDGAAGFRPDSIRALVAPL